MASSLKFKRTTTDKVAVKGLLSMDGSFITYEDDDKREREVQIIDLLKTFTGEEIDFTVSLKTEEELDIESSDTYNED